MFDPGLRPDSRDQAGPPMPWWRANAGSLLAGAILIGALSLSRGGLAVLGPILRLALPLFLIYLGWRFLKKKLGAVARAAMENAARAGGMDPRGPFGGGQAGRGQGGASGPVIDLCPRCGSYLAPGHKCKT